MIRFTIGLRPRSADGMEVIRLDRTGWRVSDGSVDEGNASRLLGYIERLEVDRYEVLWLAAPISWAYVDSFELALAAIADRANFRGEIEPVRARGSRATIAPAIRSARRRRKSNDWAFAAASTVPTDY